MEKLPEREINGVMDGYSLRVQSSTLPTVTHVIAYRFFRFNMHLRSGFGGQRENGWSASESGINDNIEK